MDLSLSPSDHAFQEDARDFFVSTIPIEIRRKCSFGEPLSRDDYTRLHAILNSRGWVVPHWPVEWGGCDWSAVRRHIFFDEMQAAAVPLPLAANIFMIGPILAAFGTEQQKQRFLSRAALLDDWWCQGFSEPEAGSDLASLRTAARRDGDVYVVDGQKIWTTFAQHADWMFCLVRTDAKAKSQAGISFLLIDMHSPGIQVRPIMTLDGHHEINQVFLDGVRVPVENLVGEENRGWEYAKYLLGLERTTIAGLGVSKERIRRLKFLARRFPSTIRPAIDDSIFRSRLIGIEVELQMLELTLLRFLSSPTFGSVSASLLKIKGSEIQQATTELLLDLVGEAALPARSPNQNGTGAAESYFGWRKVSIYGGSNEVMRNLLARGLLSGSS